jgi:hypothetical protein
MNCIAAIEHSFTGVVISLMQLDQKFLRILRQYFVKPRMHLSGNNDVVHLSPN